MAVAACRIFYSAVVLIIEAYETIGPVKPILLSPGQACSPRNAAERYTMNFNGFEVRYDF